MPITKYKFNEGAPSKAPGLYKTCLKSERDTSVRWWDGKLWWDISYSRGQKALPFAWPEGEAARGFKKPQQFNHPAYRVCLRRISKQSAVRWGEPYNVYTEAEVLKYLVDKGTLPADWKTKYQEEMREHNAVAPVGNHVYYVKEYFDDYPVRQHLIHVDSKTPAADQLAAITSFREVMLANTERWDGKTFLGYDDINGMRFNAILSDVTGKPIKPVEKVKRVTHHNVWNFFRYIGYDPKANTLLDVKQKK